MDRVGPRVGRLLVGSTKEEVFAFESGRLELVLSRDSRLFDRFPFSPKNVIYSSTVCRRRPFYYRKTP